MTKKGSIDKVQGLTIESNGPDTRIGEYCEIITPHEVIKAEVISVGEKVTLLPLGNLYKVSPGDQVIAYGEDLKVTVSENMLGRVLNGIGEPIDNKEKIVADDFYPIISQSINPLDRNRIEKPLPVGIKAVDGMLTVGKGQRIGIFSGSGVGKSTLLGMIAKHTAADVVVIALIGERGREVRDFIERDLGEAGLRRSVVIAATSDESPLMRLRGAFTATAVAEYFRDQGNDVLFLMDSVSRFARAQREIGLAMGEPPGQRGYPPSVFYQLPLLLERVGSIGEGSITAFYTVLIDADDINEPISDAIRGILDGHVFLSRDLAQKGHYPAIDVLNSVSRAMKDIVDKEHRQAAARVVENLALYNSVEDMLTLGAYVYGTNPKTDYAIKVNDKINAFLKQDIDAHFGYQKIVDDLKTLLVEEQTQAAPERKGLLSA
jgi:flagellum-specific ATP synthase